MSNDNPFEVSSDSYGDRSEADRDASSAEVSSRTIELLNQTRPWVQLIGVLMWIGVVFMALATIFLVGASLMGGGVAGGLIIGAVYGFMTFVYWFMAKSLTGYAKRINALSASESLRDLEDALEAQKNF
jgi:ABC-type multidrug transport system fused ATPase/permease subunit